MRKRDVTSLRKSEEKEEDEEEDGIGDVFVSELDNSVALS